MKIFRRGDISGIVKFLISGKIVVFPTETSYGLGCDATNQMAVDRIFKIKKRQRDKSLLVVAADVKMAKRYLEWNGILEKLSKQYWPGAVTIVGRIKNQKSPPKAGPPLAERIMNLAECVVSDEGTLALRVSAYPFLKEIAARLGRPVVATSANIADKGDIYNSKDIAEIFTGRRYQPDAVVDAGRLPRRRPTTVVSVVGKRLKVLRQGEVKVR